MRTTLNLDDDVAVRLAELAKREGTSLSRVANDVVRAGLLARERPQPLPPYDPPVLRTGKPLMDVTDISEVVGLLDETDGRG